MIYLEGVMFAVRKKLWDFLCQHRGNSDQYLWIDALGIDQGHLEERNHQVAMMGQIYRNVCLVIAWLGNAYEYDISSLADDANVATQDQHPSQASMSQVARDQLRSSLKRISQSDY